MSGKAKTLPGDGDFISPYAPEVCLSRLRRLSTADVRVEVLEMDTDVIDLLLHYRFNAQEVVTFPMVLRRWQGTQTRLDADTSHLERPVQGLSLVSPVMVLVLAWNPAVSGALLLIEAGLLMGVPYLRVARHAEATRRLIQIVQDSLSGYTRPELRKRQ